MVEDAQVAISPTMRIEDNAAKLAARKALVADGGALRKFFGAIAKRVAANGAHAPFAVGKSVTVADFRIRHLVNWIDSGESPPSLCFQSESESLF